MATAPDSYLVIDTETQHYIDPLVLQAGFCQVVDGQVVQVESLNIVPFPDVVIEKGAVKVHGLTRELLEKTGSAPDAVLPSLRETLVHCGQGWLLGQNFTFDTVAFNNTFRRASVAEVDFQQMRFIDVGVTFKAWRLQHEPAFGWERERAARQEDEGLHEYFSRIRKAPVRGLFWNVDYCMKHFHIDEPERKEHNAGEDCRLTHLIYQSMRKQGIIEEVLFEE